MSSLLRLAFLLIVAICLALTGVDARDDEQPVDTVGTAEDNVMGMKSTGLGKGIRSMGRTLLQAKKAFAAKKRADHKKKAVVKGETRTLLHAKEAFAAKKKASVKGGTRTRLQAKKAFLLANPKKKAVFKGETRTLLQAKKAFTAKKKVKKAAVKKQA